MPKEKQIVQRLYRCKLNIEQRGNEAEKSSRLIRGYFCTFNEFSRPIYDAFIEKINPRAFDKLDLNTLDVICVFNHDRSLLLGRVTNDTLTLGTDEKGGYFECEVANTRTGDEVLELIRRGDVCHCSFSFAIGKQQWTEIEGDEYDEREILEFKNLFDVSPVTDPAYYGTEVSKRENAPADYEAFKKERKKETEPEYNECEALRLRLELRKKKY